MADKLLIYCRQFRKQQLPAILKELKSIIIAEYNKLIADKLPSIAVKNLNSNYHELIGNFYKLKSIIFAEYNKLIADKLPSIAVDRNCR